MSRRTFQRVLLLGVSTLTLVALLAVPWISSAQVAPIVRLKTDLVVASGEDPLPAGEILDAVAAWRAGILLKVAGGPLDAARFPEGCTASVSITRGGAEVFASATDLAAIDVATTEIDFVQKPTALMLEPGDHVSAVVSCTGADGNMHMTELAGDL